MGKSHSKNQKERTLNGAISIKENSGSLTNKRLCASTRHNHNANGRVRENCSVGCFGSAKKPSQVAVRAPIGQSRDIDSMANISSTHDAGSNSLPNVAALSILERNERPQNLHESQTGGPTTVEMAQPTGTRSQGADDGPVPPRADHGQLPPGADDGPVTSGTADGAVPPGADDGPVPPVHLSLTPGSTQEQSTGESASQLVPSGSLNSPANLTGGPTQVDPTGEEVARRTSDNHGPVPPRDSSLTPVATQEGNSGANEAEGPATTQDLFNGTFVDKIKANKDLMQKIVLMLDRHHAVIKNWEHLVSALDAPPDVRARCKINAEYSPTERLFEHIAAQIPTLTVAEFISKLRAIGRNDIVQIICNTFNGAVNSTERLCDLIQNNMQLADEIAVKLDTKSRVNRYWKHLANQLHLSNNKIKLIESGHCNPTLAVVGYIYTEDPNFTVGKFKQIMSDMKRNDILEHLRPFIQAQEDERKKLEIVMPKDSDLMEEVSVCLNGNAGGSLKDWRHFAYQCKIPSTIYESFDPKKPHSPTELLLEWLVVAKTNFTVEQFCRKIQSIDRNDIFELIKSTLQVG